MITFSPKKVKKWSLGKLDKGRAARSDDEDKSSFNFPATDGGTVTMRGKTHTIGQ